MKSKDQRPRRAVRFRVRSGSKGTYKQLNRLAGAGRAVWNHFLDKQNSDYLAWLFSSGPRPTYPSAFNLYKEFTSLRHSAGYEWLQEHSASVVRDVLRKQSIAWAGFFEDLKKPHLAPEERRGKPQFKSRFGKAGFTIPDKVQISGNRIYVPKVGWVVLSRKGGNPYTEGTPKQAAFFRKGDKWYCTVFYAVDVALPLDNGNVIAMDRNAGQITLSNGMIIRMPDVQVLEARKKRYQRELALKTEGSCNFKRIKAKIAATEAKIADIRNNWQHQVTRNIAERYGTVVIEELDTKRMTKKGKGSRKSSLNKSVRDTGWTAFEQKLAYKVHKLVKVPAAYTSQRCNSCGFISRSNRTAQSQFRCRACGYSANADYNAAQNIEALHYEEWRPGLAHLAGERRGKADTPSMTHANRYLVHAA